MTTKTIFQFIFVAVAIILFIDFIGFFAWVFSGQVPADSFFIGAITKSILMMFM